MVKPKAHRGHMMTVMQKKMTSMVKLFAGAVAGITAVMSFGSDVIFVRGGIMVSV